MRKTLLCKNTKFRLVVNLYLFKMPAGFLLSHPKDAVAQICFLYPHVSFSKVTYLLSVQMPPLHCLCKLQKGELWALHLLMFLK